METYAFDGIDVDWEVDYFNNSNFKSITEIFWQYPAASDRGGIPADKENYVTFMQRVKTAFAPRKYELTL